ncbi:cytochrome b [Pseudooceanicola sp. 216_PA32_1]|uniref:Cytochrome b n=1 Tax=Pseudooceanicola pacificus TaxID=2676438 RepID=A0A844WDF9_9RHOB|nr:cytochrome b/b6 domain-containing protein [Pseudooceanicola pacificus]MWB77730.1 cytochrome b [Pseudooceanicola pacificus]
MPTTYSRTQIVLHWAVVLLILVQFLAHDGMEHAWDALEDTGTAATTPGALLHIVAGLGVLALALWRLGLRATRGAPPPPEGDGAAQRLAAAVTHWVLYALILLIPLSGAAAWFLGAEPAGEAHEVLTSLILVVTALHVAAALYHQFVKRDGLLARMWRPG